MHWWFSGKIGACHASMRQPRVRFPANAVDMAPHWCCTFLLYTKCYLSGIGWLGPTFGLRLRSSLNGHPDFNEEIRPSTREAPAFETYEE